MDIRSTVVSNIFLVAHQRYQKLSKEILNWKYQYIYSSLISVRQERQFPSFKICTAHLEGWVWGEQYAHVSIRFVWNTCLHVSSSITIYISPLRNHSNKDRTLQIKLINQHYHIRCDCSDHECSVGKWMLESRLWLMDLHPPELYGAQHAGCIPGRTE
jgi:hypothetical protein